MEDTIKCPVVIAGVACDAPIADQEGKPVGAGDGRIWIVCAPCEQRGVHVHDVDHAPPALDLR
jgi:hypothetical protein